MTGPGKREKRRAILAAAVRWPLAGGLALLAARLVAWATAGGPLDPAEKCVNQGLCRGCRALGACRSPQAELFRQETSGRLGDAPERRRS